MKRETIRNNDRMAYLASEDGESWRFTAAYASKKRPAFTQLGLTYDKAKEAAEYWAGGAYLAYVKFRLGIVKFPCYPNQ